MVGSMLLSLCLVLKILGVGIQTVNLLLYREMKSIM